MTLSSSVTSAVTGDGDVGRPDLRGHPLRRRPVPVGDDDAGALGGQPLRHGPADARARRR